MAESEAVPAIRVMMMPRDTNGEGTIFGGVILSYMDQAGAIESRRHTRHKVVTVALDKVEFHQPVFVGDVLSVYTELKKVGRTSLTVKIRVEAERQRDPRELVQVTTAEFVYVAIDEQRRPVAVRDAG